MSFKLSLLQRAVQYTVHCKVVTVCGKVAAAVERRGKALFDRSKLVNKNWSSTRKGASSIVKSHCRPLHETEQSSL